MEGRKRRTSSLQTGQAQERDRFSWTFNLHDHISPSLSYLQGTIYSSTSASSISRGNHPWINRRWTKLSSSKLTFNPPFLPLLLLTLLTILPLLLRCWNLLQSLQEPPTEDALAAATAKSQIPAEDAPLKTKEDVDESERARDLLAEKIEAWSKK